MSSSLPYLPEDIARKISQKKVESISDQMSQFAVFALMHIAVSILVQVALLVTAAEIEPTLVIEVTGCMVLLGTLGFLMGGVDRGYIPRRFEFLCSRTVPVLLSFCTCLVVFYFAWHSAGLILVWSFILLGINLGLVVSEIQIRLALRALKHSEAAYQKALEHLLDELTTEKV